MKLEQRLVHNRFIIAVSLITLIWSVYVSMRLIDFGGAIPNTKDTFILHNVVNTGLIYGFGVLGVLGILVGVGPYMPHLKSFVLIVLFILWTMLAFFFVYKDFVLTGFVTFSTILICSVAIALLVELWVGEAT